MMETRIGDDPAPRGETRATLLGPLGKLLLGVGVVAPGLLALIYQTLDYILVPYVCAGVRSAALFHVLAVATLAALAVAGLIAWRLWRRGGGEWETEEGTVPAAVRFVGLVGFVSATFFALIVLGMWAAHFVLDPCQ
jgi:hypothetical protein